MFVKIIFFHQVEHIAASSGLWATQSIWIGEYVFFFFRFWPGVRLINDAFLLACRFAALLCECHLQIHGYIAEWHCSWVELNSTVCDLPLWAKQLGDQFIGKTLLATWSSQVAIWHLRSCTNIMSKVAS